MQRNKGDEPTNPYAHVTEGEVPETPGYVCYRFLRTYFSWVHTSCFFPGAIALQAQ